MSIARDDFLELGWAIHCDQQAFEKLFGIADLWRKGGQHFSAGVAMSRAIDAAWGRPDQMIQAYSTAVTDFERELAIRQPAHPAWIRAYSHMDASQPRIDCR
jgi:hypothetical protein